ncbi:plant basic secretory protein [Sparassis latifolia]
MPPYNYSPVYLSPPPAPPSSYGEPSSSWPIPTFELRVEDLAHPGARMFLESTQPADALKDAVIAVCSSLYTHESVPMNVRSVLLVLRSGMGVPAYTTGGPTHKEINVSLDHIRNCAVRAKDEILGVLTHEMTHCYQYNARGTCPGGLVEGVADWVRLRAGFVPPHWRAGRGDKWDAGYDSTAYFLEWIESRYGCGTVRELNATMKDKEYTPAIFEELTGHDVKGLWKLYREYIATNPKSS